MFAPHASTATIERLIVGKAVDHLLQKFGFLSVETGHQDALLDAGGDADTVLAAALSTNDPEAWLFTPEREHFVKLVLGNGIAVISDYHVELEEVLKPANNLAKALEA